MAKKVEVTLKTQALELVNAMGLTVPTVKGFETEFLTLDNGERNAKAQWLEMSVIAPVVFGEGCFTKEKAKGEEWNADYAFFKETLESAVCMKAYGVAMPDIQRVKPGTVLTAKQTADRAMAQYVRATFGVHISRMAKYFSDAVGAEHAPRALPTLAAWCGTAVITLAGKAETTKTKAVAPKVSGAVPQVLLDLLACYTKQDAKEFAECMADFRAQMVKEDARIKSVQAIQAAQNKPRKAAPSDTPKAKRTIKA